MNDTNLVILTGRAGGDAELRYTEKGTAMATFSMAVSRQARGDNGQRNEATDWVRIVTWAKLAETVAETLKKGQRVFVEGRLSVRSWQDQQGQKRTTTEVVASSVLAMSGVAAGTGIREVAA